MDNAPKKRAYTKSRLIKELSYRAGISQNQSRAALEALIEIAYREARANYFILPGLCKFDVVQRNERTVRNPATGETLILPPRESLHVSLSKRAKETVVPRVTPLKPEEYEIWKKEHAEQSVPAAEPSAPAAEAPVPAAQTPAPAEEAPIPAAEAPVPVAEAPVQAAEAPAPVAETPVPEAETPAPVAEPPVPAAEAPVPPAEVPTPDVAAQPAAEAEEPAPEQPAAPEIQATQGAQEISFTCTTCGQEVIAPAEAIGCEAECPVCGTIIVIPAQSEPGTTYASDLGTEKEIISTEEAEDLLPSALKNRTIRIDSHLFDDVVGLHPEPPPTDKMLEAMKNRTMRIDLPDEF